jgi:hypothetical protein
MKNLFCLLILSVLTVNSYTQTKEDTQAWISEKIENFRYDYKYHIYNVKFKEGDMIIENTTANTLFYSKIPLKKVSQINVEYFNNEGKEGYIIRIGCKNAEKCVETGKIVDGVLQRSIYDMELIKIFLNVNFKQDNLPERMKKALLHIVKLNGGKVISETF